MDDETTILYRPVGPRELELIHASDDTAFPPRLPEQPIFYPVLNYEYALQIARGWNTKDAASGYMGAVTAFQVSSDYALQFAEHIVGGIVHRELWVPAEQLDEFNGQIVDKIRILTVFYGERYSGERAW